MNDTGNKIYSFKIDYKRFEKNDVKGFKGIKGIAWYIGTPGETRNLVTQGNCLPLPPSTYLMP